MPLGIDCYSIMQRLKILGCNSIAYLSHPLINKVQLKVLSTAKINQQITIVPPNLSKKEIKLSISDHKITISKSNFS